MCKKILYLFLLLVLCISLSACDKAKTIILFNQNPITKDNFLNNSNKFTTGKRIYYIFITEKPLQNDFLRIRILKREDKANMAISKVIYSNDFKLSKDQLYYYNDYIVINSAGYYSMVVYAKNKLDRPLTSADFQVTD